MRKYWKDILPSIKLGLLVALLLIVVIAIFRSTVDDDSIQQFLRKQITDLSVGELILIVVLIVTLTK